MRVCIMEQTGETGISIVGIRFKARGKEYSFDAAGIPLKKGDRAIVDTENGPAIAVVSTEVRKLERSEVPENLKKVVRKASDEDLVTERHNTALEERAFDFCDGRIRERDLPMKLIDVECLFDKSKIVFYFTADSRVDFRELVKDLVQEFRSRIELRQIWVRSEARIVGGMGVCGRELCCVSFLNNFEPVSIKMAKEQNMLLNPEKISGRCGRLMCCLAFEYNHYCETKKALPKCGMVVQADRGRGKVVRQNILAETIMVAFDDGQEVEMSAKDVT
jgi:cell fate regulator YaaT (PSP1 superfamily)